MNEALVTAMADLEEDDLFELVRADVDAGRPAVDIIADLQKGLDIVGERFSSKEYFLSELIMSADIFLALLPEIPGSSAIMYGTILQQYAL